MDRCPPATKAWPLAGAGRVGEDGTVESLARLREQRAFCCRLSPDRALGSVEEADAFLRDRGLLTRIADCALPGLYEACHEDPYRPGSPGFPEPATRGAAAPCDIPESCLKSPKVTSKATKNRRSAW
jgi:hypothetical protein